jgi:hypothetical protein
VAKLVKKQEASSLVYGALVCRDSVCDFLPAQSCVM